VTRFDYGLFVIVEKLSAGLKITGVSEESYLLDCRNE